MLDVVLGSAASLSVWLSTMPIAIRATMTAGVPNFQPKNVSKIARHGITPTLFRGNEALLDMHSLQYTIPMALMSAVDRQPRSSLQEAKAQSAALGQIMVHTALLELSNAAACALKLVMQIPF